MKMIKRDQENKQEVNIETNLKEKEIKKENMEKNRYLNMSEEKKKRLKNIKKIIVRQKSLNIIMNKIVF